MATTAVVIVWHATIQLSEQREMVLGVQIFKPMLQRLIAGDVVPDSEFLDPKLAAFGPMAREMHALNQRGVERAKQLDASPASKLISNALSPEVLKDSARLGETRRAATIYSADLTRAKAESLLDMNALPARVEAQLDPKYKRVVARGIQETL